METLNWLTSLFSNCLLCDGDDGCTRDRMLMFAYLYLIIVLIQSVKFAAPYGKFLQQSSNNIPDTFLSFRINSTYGWMLQAPGTKFDDKDFEIKKVEFLE